MKRAGVVALLLLSFAFVLVVVLAFAGVEPLASGKDLLAESAREFRAVTGDALAPAVATAGEVSAVERLFMAGGTEYNLKVVLTPSRRALPDEEYTVELYEKEELRETLTVSWNEPEVNVLKEKAVYFAATQTEYRAYRGRSIAHVFSVKIIE